jgi:zinc protease
MSLSAQKIDRTKPPKTASLPAFNLPPVYETTLPNGLQLLLVEDRRFPLVTVRLGFQAGSKFDSKDLPGLSEAVGELLTEGTRARSSRQIAEELAAIGGSLRAASNADSLLVYGNALAEHMATLLELLADVALNANFPDGEVEIYKNRRKQELLAEQSEPAFWADEKLASLIFGVHPYSRLNPTLESIDRLDRGALTGFGGRYLAPNNAVLVLLGSLPPREETLKLLRSHFGDWARKEAPAEPAPKFPEASRTITLVDRPGSVQADIRVGQLGVSRSNPDYFPLLVANTILGGGASSRLFANVREQKGYAYDVRSSVQPRKNAGLFTVITQVRNDVLEPALGAVEAEMKQMGEKAVPAGELTDVKNYLSGVFVLGLETQGGLASQLSRVRLMGLPNDYLEKYTTRVRSVTSAQIQAVARNYITPEDAGVVVVGDASKIKRLLEKLGKVAVEEAE